MSSNRGNSWQYPYSVIHPTESTADFGAVSRLDILENGDILTINNGSPRGNAFSGLSRWDGTQWHSYGNGLFGSTSRAFDFEFYKGELYMGGTFNKYDFPQDPGNFVVRWDGQQWRDLAGGITGFVRDLFTYDGVLYCHMDGGFISDHKFGDAYIPYFAGWDGHQWCGTPANFGNTPNSFGMVNDTLFVSFTLPVQINGGPANYLFYFDGNYIHGPNAICSTPGLGEKETTQQPQFNVYPNPASRSISILRNGNEDISLKFYDLNGKLVFRHFMPGTQQVIDLPNEISSGIYLVNITSEKGVSCQKLIIH